MLNIVGDTPPPPPELLRGGPGRRACNSLLPLPPSGAGSSMPSVCGASWAPLHTCQYIQTAVPVQGVVALAQIKEYGMEDRLPHGDEIL